jgi:hypothetical protein
MPPAISGDLALPTVPLTFSTTPLEEPDALAREPLLELRVPVERRADERLLLEALREELREAAERVDPERFDAGELPPEPFVLALLERGFEEL